MSDVADEVRFSLKLMINKEKTKVLFACVNSDFADILLSFLTFPLGGILRLLTNHYGREKAPRIGCLSSLYSGLQNLDSFCFWTEAGKQMLLDPRSSRLDEYHKLRLNVFDTRPTRYFACECKKICIDYDSLTCPGCDKSMNILIEARGASENKSEAFAKQGVSFLIGDDMRMVPNVSGSIMKTLNNLEITDIDGAEFSTVSAGLNEIMDLLKLSLFSRTPLTDLFLPERPPTKKSKVEGIQMKKGETLQSKRMKITATVRKSKNEFLFAQADEAFVDFLFSLLTIPLGQVESLLSMNSSLGCIDNLYRSVASFDGKKCLKDEDTKDILLKPNLPSRYLSTHQVFSLEEEEETTLYYQKNENGNIDYVSKLYTSISRNLCYLHSFRDPKGKGSYVKSGKMFMVTDDLTVTPLCMLSSLSLLKELEIPVSDIDEIEISIGPEEALSILRASLTSTSALTNGLMLREMKKIHAPHWLV